MNWISFVDIRLSGTQAFPGKSEKEQMENITGPSEIDFADELWIAISNYAQSWIRKCLNKMPDQRMTITEALSHPWLNVMHHLSFI